MGTAVGRQAHMMVGCCVIVLWVSQQSVQDGPPAECNIMQQVCATHIMVSAGIQACALQLKNDQSKQYVTQVADHYYHTLLTIWYECALMI